ncbi:N-acetyltransferase [Streptomyces sp. NPDC052396]|uniref:N-acetyltransferase n=1 Tax=Streptomyces sp. NPDC052396 TaxID=3365689 RepID=UPI0037D2903E
MSWLPEDFAHPTHVPLPGGGYHLRPVTGGDAHLDYRAVMGSRQRLWSLYGEDWGWPRETMTFEENQKDLIRHEREIAAHLSFNYALLDDGGTALLGCVYIDPAGKTGADAEISWWVVDDRVGSSLNEALDALVPSWIAEEWPFRQPRYIGHDISWQEWRTLPNRA